VLSYLLLTFESFDTLALVAATKDYDPNGVIIVWNYNGEIQVVHSPPGLKLPLRFRYCTLGSVSENRWIKWPRLIFTITYLTYRIAFHSKIRRLFISGADVMAWLSQPLKLIGRVERLVITLEDWSDPRQTDGFIDSLNKVKAVLNDLFLMSTDTSIVAFTPQILEARRRFWGDLANRRTKLYPNKWAGFVQPRTSLPGRRNRQSIALVGTLRKNFGIEMLFEILPELNSKYGLRLKVIGPEFESYREYQALAASLPCRDMIDWRGFVPNELIAGELEDCFCGYNIQELENNNSRLTIPGRVIHYLQSYVVPVVSPSSGAIVDFIKERKVGIICDPRPLATARAIEQTYLQNATYIDRIDQFFRNNPYRMTPETLLEL
jgi:glycosyltransferase involved in cell wall biosynthesis